VNPLAGTRARGHSKKRLIGLAMMWAIPFSGNLKPVNLVSSIILEIAATNNIGASIASDDQLRRREGRGLGNRRELRMSVSSSRVHCVEFSKVN
jgi:hypothetical protein